MDVRVKLCECMLNSGRIFQLLPATPVLRTLVQYLIAFGSRQEAASDVVANRSVRLTVSDESVKLGDPRLNRS